MTRELFASSMGFLQSIVGHTLTDGARGAYWTALKDMPDDTFKQAVSELVKGFVPTSQVPFPVPAHFLRSTGQDNESRVSRVMGILQQSTIRVGAYSSIDFKDKALHTTITRFGGWIAVCKWTEKDWQLNTRAFSDAYAAALRFGENGPKHLAGIYESQNGYLEDGQLAVLSIDAPDKVVYPRIEHKQSVEISEAQKGSKGAMQSIGDIAKGGV